MGYRYFIPSEKAGDADYRMMEVVLMKRGNHGAEQAETRIVAVDNQWDTLRYVQENMDNFIGNIVQVRKIEVNSKKNVEESSRLFEKKLEPLFTKISTDSKANVLEKLSSSLKKALILMAMDRYHSDKETICQALGISRDKLERELKICGLVPQRRKVA